MRGRLSWVWVVVLGGCTAAATNDGDAGVDARTVDVPSNDSAVPIEDAGIDAGSDGGADAGSDGGGGCASDCASFGDACHIGRCNDATGSCEAIPRSDGTTCDDADACTTLDACVSGACVGTARDCASSTDACHVGVCDPTSGACSAVPVANGTACSDGSACTTGDVCTAGVCGGAPLDCSAMSDGCNAASCDPATGTCTRTARPNGTACSDGNLCSTTDVCTGGVCGGTPVLCTSSMCSTAMCSPSTGACASTPLPNGTACTFDTNACTRDECGSGSCGATLICRPPSDFMPFGTRVNTAVVGTSGTMTADFCPTGSALVGVEVQIGSGISHIGTIHGICRSLSISGSGAGPYTLLDEGPNVLTPNRGSSGTGTLRSSVCPVGQIVVGFSGRSGTSVDALAVRCAPLSITATPAEWVISLGGTTTSASAGGSGGGAFAPIDCPAGHVATAMNMNATTSLDGFGLWCQPAQLSYAITFTSAGVTPTHGGGGGTAFDDACPAGRTVIGYDGWVSASGSVSLVRAACARLEVVGPIATPSLVQRDFDAPVSTPDRGTPGSTTFSLRCSPGDVAAGFAGREGTLIDQMVLRCGSLRVVGSSITRPSIGTRSMAGGTGGTAFGNTDCGANAFTTRNVGRAGVFVDALAMGCSTAAF